MLFNMQERSLKYTDYFTDMFFKDTLAFCTQSNSVKLFQISEYVSTTEMVIKCLLNNWTFYDNYLSERASISDKYIPFEIEVSKLTGIPTPQIVANPSLILDFIYSFIQSCDLALEYQCKDHFESEKNSFGHSYNSVFSKYSILKYGKERSDFLLPIIKNFDDQPDLKPLQNNQIYRSVSFFQLSSDILRFMDRIKKSNSINAGYLAEFIYNCSQRYPEYPDYIVSVGFLCYFYSFIVNRQSNVIRNSQSQLSLQHFHLYWSLTGDYSGYSGKLLTCANNYDGENSTAPETDKQPAVPSIDLSNQSKEDQLILNEIFNPVSSERFSLTDIILNKSIEKAIHYSIIHSINNDISSQISTVVFPC